MYAAPLKQGNLPCPTTNKHYAITMSSKEDNQKPAAKSLQTEIKLALANLNASDNIRNRDPTRG